MKCIFVREKYWNKRKNRLNSLNENKTRTRKLNNKKNKS